MNSQAIRESVNEKLIEALSNNILPWRRPWSGGNGGRHRNYATNRAYSGVNPLLLEMHNLKHELVSNQWATFRQWQSLGCQVKKRPADVPAGQWGCNVVLCKPVKKTVVDKVTGEEGDSRYFIFGESGHLAIAKLSPKGYEEIDRAKLLEPTNECFGRQVVWSHPAFANKCVFARNDKEIVCFSLASE